MRCSDGTTWPAFLEFEELQEPQLAPVTNFKDWVSIRFEFRSWAWQLVNVVDCSDALAPGLRPFQTSDEAPILVTCAKAVWFSLQRSDLMPVALFLELDAKRAPNLFDLLFLMTKSVLECDDAATLQVLSQRFNTLMHGTSMSAGILQVDKAARTLDENDRIELQKAQQKVHTKAMDLDTFQRAYKQKRQEVAGGKVATAAKRVKKEYKGPRQFALNSAHTDQKEVKKFFPPKSYVWRARRADTWNACYMDFPCPLVPRRSLEWRAGGHPGVPPLLLAVVPHH